MRNVVREAVLGVRKALPTQKQIERMDRRLRDLDRRVSGIARKGGVRKKGTGKVGRPRTNPLTCRMKDCAQPARAKALCSRHYQQRRRKSMSRQRRTK
ncbi:MAG: hypothetical protein ACE5IK_01585 [Acidobacteriota bacterium]